MENVRAAARLVYKNLGTGKALDLTDSVSAAKLVTKRLGSPAQLNFTCEAAKGLVWRQGSLVCLLPRGNGRGWFYGYVFSVVRNMDGTVDVTAYDQMRYLKNKDTYVFENKRADEILRLIAADFGLKCGKIADTGYEIPALCMDGASLFDIILRAVELTEKATGRQYCLWDDYGKLRLTAADGLRADVMIGDESMAADYAFESEIDTDTYSVVKLVRDGAGGGREVFVFENAKAVKKYGRLQLLERLENQEEAGGVQDVGKTLLAAKSKARQRLTLTALPLKMGIRAGYSVFVWIQDLNLRRFLQVEEARHDLISGKMNLKVVV